MERSKYYLALIPPMAVIVFFGILWGVTMGMEIAEGCNG